MANTPFSGLELNINVRPWETETSDVRETTNKNLLENFNSHSGDSNGKEIYEITPKNGESLEPCIGMDFKSLEDAKEFYEEYGMRTGFTIRNGHVRRSRKDNSIIGRELVCTKEGYPVKKDQNPEKRVLPSRPVTREGCNATLRVAKKDVGKWVITGFIKQHSHQLNPGKIRPPQDDKDRKIRELSELLQHEKKLRTACQRQLNRILNDIEEHNQKLSLKVEVIVKNVRELESEEDCSSLK